MNSVVTLGEMMLRLMPENNRRLEQADRFDAYYGGDESIVATLLSRFGMDVRYLTKLPEGILGDICERKLWEQHVDTRFIKRGSGRLGVNFYENGASVRPSMVVYDRANSVMSKAEFEDFDWDGALNGAKWFHVSGITPALGPSCARMTRYALEAARRAGVTTSVDLNYRRNLWTPEQAQQVMIPLMEYVDVLIGNEEDAHLMLGVKPGHTDVIHGKLDLKGYEECFTTLRQRYGFKIIATTLRESRSASDNGWSGLVYDGEQFCHSRQYDIHLVDRGGGGAAFSGGLIYGLCTGKSLHAACEFAAAASALKQTILGDFNLITLAEVERLALGDTSGRVQR